MTSPSPVRGIAPARLVAAAALGNALEFYDFTVYSFFAVMIGRAFFPAGNPTTSLLLSVATYGAGYVTRPVGGVVIGAFADTHGRRAAMTLTFGMMALGTGLLALVPPYAAIGLAAPVLVVTARLIQGFSAGGEMGPATAYLIESAPAGRRGFFGSWQSAGQNVATISAGLVGFALSSLLPPDALQLWGWRVALAVGLLIAPVGLYVRNRLPETLARRETPARQGRQPRPGAAPASVLRTLLAEHPGTVLLGILTIMGAAVSVAILGYMTTYAIAVLKVPTGTAMLATLCAGLAGLAGGLLGGTLSDRVGRKPVMILPRIAFLVLIYPAFLLITTERTTAALLTMTAAMALLQSMSSAVMLVQIPECFPRRLRSTGLSLVYTVAVMLFGGTAQFVVTWMIAATGNPLSPAWYLVGMNAACILAMSFIPARAVGRALNQSIGGEAG